MHAALLVERLARLRDVVGQHINPASPKQISDWLRRHLDAGTLEKWPTTDTGQLKLNADTLARYGHLPLVKPLLDFKVELAVVVAFLLIVVLGPLLLFMPHLGRARRIGLREYGTLGQRYVREFDQKWLRGGARADEPLVGSGDIQSLADLGNSFEVVQRMRLVPFTKETILQLAVVTLAPVAPLALTMVSLEELLKRLLQVVF